MSNAFPWSRLWSLESKYETPEGGLILHWIFSVILIIATTRINNIEEAIAFPGTLQAYATGIIGGKSSCSTVQIFSNKRRSTRGNWVPIPWKENNTWTNTRGRTERMGEKRQGSLSIHTTTRCLSSNIHRLQPLHRDRSIHTTIQQSRWQATRDQRMVLSRGCWQFHSCRLALLSDSIWQRTSFCIPIRKSEGQNRYATNT